MNWRRNWSFKKDFQRFVQAGPTAWCAQGAGILVSVWTFLMFAVFPFYMKNHYSKLGVRKFEFFLAVSVICLLPAAFLGGLRMVLAKLRNGHRNGPSGSSPTAKVSGWKSWAGVRQHFSLLDGAMLLYLAAAGLSWYGSIDRDIAWTGVNGWFIGLRSQLLFVLIYFLVSRFFQWKKVLLAAYLFGSGLTFVFGILHRFGMDPLGMYKGIDASYQLRFLSTIGQATWYSSYVCTLLVIGVTIFFLADSLRVRVVTGIYCMLGFATVVTQNSDSAFAAVAFLFFGLFLAACDSMEGMERFFETVLLMLGSFKITGLLQQFFPERAMQLGGLSEFLSQSMQTWLVFLGVCVLYMAFLFYRQANPRMEVPPAGKALRRAAVFSVVGFLLCYVLFVWMNTAGLLERWFGFRSENQYLLFEKTWGNSRGFTWKFVVETFAAFPLLRKLIGVGPDCFSAYCYADPALGGYLNRFFGQNQTLTNAHNEFLNTLFCLGILGLAAFLLIFGTAFWRFYQKRKECPVALVGVLVVLVYAAHNFFCYQQVCCTPFFFLILGMAENAVTQRGQTDGFGIS